MKVTVSPYPAMDTTMDTMDTFMDTKRMHCM